MRGGVLGAVKAWRKLYGGELRALPAPAADLTSVAVYRRDFRPDPGNWPKILHHGQRTDRVLVLIHGLKDSPGYLEPIALRFAAQGLNVVLPLLPGHGNRNPVMAMRKARLKAWRSTVQRAVEIAANFGKEVSIGGLSTGGALAIDRYLKKPSAIRGKIFLFSAALGLSLKARYVVRSWLLCRALDIAKTRKGDTGLGGNPLKYSRNFFVAGRQVHLLIRAIKRRAGTQFKRLEAQDRLFVAHSEADTTIPIRTVLPLVRTNDPGQHHLISKALGVAHADLVLPEAIPYTPLRDDEPDPPRANPEFEVMFNKALVFMER